MLYPGGSERGKTGMRRARTGSRTITDEANSMKQGENAMKQGANIVTYKAVGMKAVLFVTCLFALLATSFIAAHAEHSLHITVVEPDDDFIDTGFAEAGLSAVLTRNGMPASDVEVVWEVIAVDTFCPAVPEAYRSRISGLSWVKPVPGRTDPVEPMSSTTDASGRAEAVLTDIIGERTVLVRATAVLDGEIIAAERKVRFGKGPLSIFASPFPEMLSWLDFYKACNGTPYSGDPLAWSTGVPGVGGPKMPTLEQMKTVSMTGKYNTLPSAMGAAVAAGWPTGEPDDDLGGRPDAGQEGGLGGEPDGGPGGRRYWANRGTMKGRASHISIRDGNPHGFGGNDVWAREYGVCLR